jgi:preprotein translocase subunit YajC
MDPLTIGMLVILAVLIFFMFRNGQKRKRDQEQLQSKVVPGAEVMTNFGLFGTILAIDEGDNKVQLETAPGQVVTVHRQTISRVIDEEANAAVVEADETTSEISDPEFGQRTTEAGSLADEAQPTESRDKKNDE